jgi:hypothetical protein
MVPEGICFALYWSHGIDLTSAFSVKNAVTVWQFDQADIAVDDPAVFS